jgi:glycogen phosphorylase
VTHDGTRDVEDAVARLAARLPEPLAPFARLAYDYAWSWAPDGAALFRALDPRRWEICGENPVRLLQEADPAALARAAADAGLVARARALAAPAAPAPTRPIAFFCAEYGLHRSLPIYSGGLGALAGDILKECSDQAVPLVAVGLFYRQGYFHQRLDASGWQHEYWEENDVERLPAALVTGPDGQPLVVAVGAVRLQIWRVDVGRVPLYLLDSARPENSAFDRWITGRLYVTDREARLLQYLALGIGGVRALRAMGLDPRALHLNEGHAAFAPLELAREGVAAGMTFADALAAARARMIFTTHTPVPAGNESYPGGQVAGAVGEGFLRELGIGAGELLELGRIHPGDGGEPFGVTTLALRTSRAANGVSRRHGAVARAMWRPLWPGRQVDDVPIGHVTNGVHLPTWMAPEMRALLDRWPDVGGVPPAELWAARCRLRAALVDYVRERSQRDRLSRGDARDYVEAAARTFDPGALTIGFARRLATYKRLELITRDPARSLALLSGPRQIQLVIAGKAHPADDEAKRVVQQRLFPLRQHPQVGARVAYLEDYDLGMALQLVRGCDVWVNLPRPPLEASGTSGMKAAMNGALNLSVLDGWWDEASDGENGWSISGEVSGDWAAQDERDAAALYDLLEREIVPLFYERDADGVPRRWLERVKRSLATITTRFTAARMVGEYRGRWEPGRGSP